MSASLERRDSSEHLLEDHDYEHTDCVARRASQARSSFWRRAPKLIAIIILALAAVLAAYGVVSKWRSSAAGARRSTNKLRHRSACSTYPEDCEKTAPFVFDSVYSLLKQWPSTYAPNGHSVVPATVATNTLLYHAKSRSGPPEKPTFFAFDAEMSIGIYGSTGTPVLHTMTTTRQLHVLYLDGHSATLTTTGTLDSQMALLRNHVPTAPSEDLTYDEDQRALALCRLADELNLDGIVRMNTGFEVLVCDYGKSGVQELFAANITVPGKSRSEHRELELEGAANLPRDPNRQPPLGFGNDFAEQNGWEWVRSGAWHYGGGQGGEATGEGISEKRVRLDLSRFISWYDPSFRSLSGLHHGGLRGNDTYQNGWGLRRGHRLLGVTEEDIAMFREWLRTAISAQEEEEGSGTDWQTLVETIVDSFRGRANEILFNLERDIPSEDGDKEKDTDVGTAYRQIISNVYSLSHAVLYPYLEYPAIAGVPKSEAKARTLDRCTAAYTGHIDLNSLSEFEVLTKESTQIVVNGLCRWAWNVFEWTDSRMYNHLESTAHSHSQSHAHTTSTPNGNKGNIAQEILRYKHQTQSLLQWIGWDVSHGCKERCAQDELCYIPMWPVIYAPGQRQGGIYAGSVLSNEETQEFWAPKCLKRSDFDCGGGRAREPQHQLPDVPYEQCRSTHHRE